MTRPIPAPPRWLVVGAVPEAALLAAFFLVPFSHLWGQMPPPSAQRCQSSSAGLAGALGVALIFGLPSLVPFGLIALLPDDDGRWTTSARLGPLVALMLLPALVALGTYPCCTSDVLDYVNRQRLWTVYGENPFLLVPNDHPEDWSYYFANFKDLVFSYGPVWWLIARAFTQWASSLDEYLLGFKALAALSFGASVALLWQLADKRRRLVALAFFVWNPAVLIEGLLRLHNDLLTVPFVLAAFWRCVAGRDRARRAGEGDGRSSRPGAGRRAGADAPRARSCRRASGVCGDHDRAVCAFLERTAHLRRAAGAGQSPAVVARLDAVASGRTVVRSSRAGARKAWARPGMPGPDRVDAASTAA